MSDAHVARGRHERLGLAADACLVSSAAFGLATAASLPLALLETEPGAWVALPVSVIIMATWVTGPVLAWWARGRRVTWSAAVGGLLTSVLAGFCAPLLALFAAGLGWVLQPITTAELAGPIALAIIGAVGYLLLTLVSIVAGLRQWRRGERTRVAKIRLIGLVAFIGFVVAAVAFVIVSSNPERGELAIFAIVAGAFGALTVVGADLGARVGQARQAQAAARQRAHPGNAS